MSDRNTRIRSSQIFDNGVQIDDLHDDVKKASIQLIIDGGGSTIVTGNAGDIEVPFDCEIQKVTLLAKESGSIQIDIYNGTYASHPPSSSITASAIPSISSSTKYQDSTLTGWTKSLTGGTILRFNVDSVTTITRCTISLEIKKV